MAITITDSMNVALDTAHKQLKQKELVFPTNPKPRNVVRVTEFLSALITAWCGCLHKMTFEGKPVNAFDLSECVKVTEILFGAHNKWSGSQVMDILRKHGAVVYKPTRLKWKGDNSFFPTFAKAWNESGGDPQECSKLLGTDSWNVPLMSPDACQTKYDMYRDDEAANLASQDPTTVRSKGRKGIEIPEEVKEATLDIIADRIATLNAGE